MTNHRTQNGHGSGSHGGLEPVTLIEFRPRSGPAPRRPADSSQSLQQLSTEEQDRAVGARAESHVVPAPLRPCAPSSPLFRQQAVLAYERGERIASVLKVSSPRSWALLASVLAGLFIALVASVWCTVDVTGRGRGVLRGAGGAQTLSAAIGGQAERLHVQSGDEVVADQAILTLDSTALRAEVVQAGRQVDFARARLNELEKNRRLHERSVNLLRTQAWLQQRRLRSEGDTLPTLEARRRTYSDLYARGLLTRLEVEAVREEIRSVERRRFSLQEDLSRTQLQVVMIERERSEQRDRIQVELEAARAHQAALDTMLVQTVVRAPGPGRIEGFETRVGDQLQAGQPVAKLVPLGAPVQVIVFADERDRAFLSIGAPARVEVDQLPLAEFGVVTGHISALGAHFASRSEQASALADDAIPDTPRFRVEIVLERTAHNRRLIDRLPAGALVNARFRLRSRRVIALVFEPLQLLLEHGG